MFMKLRVVRVGIIQLVAVVIMRVIRQVIQEVIRFINGKYVAVINVENMIAIVEMNATVGVLHGVDVVALKV